MKIVGLVSSFREGPLLESAIRSLAALDHVLVCEGPVEQNTNAQGSPSVVPQGKGYEWITAIGGEYPADAAKRTAMIRWVQDRRWLAGEEAWGLWLDGDEILLWGEYLRDWVYRASLAGTTDDPAAGWPLSIVEPDGSVAWCMGKLVRVDLIERYLISSSFIEMKGGATRTVGNVQCWTPLDGPTQFTEVDGKRLPHWRARPPLQGEPHLVHRWHLREKTREVERQHRAEERNYKGADLQ